MYDTTFNDAAHTSIFKIRTSTVYVGFHPSATDCNDYPSIFSGFGTRWALKDTGSVQEGPGPGTGLNGEGYYITDASTCSYNTLFDVDIMSYVGLAQVDTFTIFTGYANDEPVYHSPTVFRWPTVLNEYFDSCTVYLKKRLFPGGPIGYVIQGDMTTISSLSFPVDTTTLAAIRLYIRPKGVHTSIPGAPPVPVPIFPANGATGDSLSLTLSWTIPAAGADSFYLQLSKDSTFATNLIFNGVVQSSSKLISGLSQKTTYFWRVLAFNKYGVSLTPAAPYRFTTLTLTLPAPNLLLPANHAIGVSTTPLLVWNSVSGGATSYGVQVSTVPNFSSTVVDQSGLTDTTYQVPSTLSNCQTYYWRANTTNAAGPGSFSAPDTFRIALATPSVPIVTAPANGALGVSISPVLSWSVDVCTDTTLVQVARDAGFTQVIISQKVVGTSLGIGPLGQDSTYYWALQGINASGSSAVSSIDSFHTLLNPPAPPALLLPAAADTTVPALATFTWSGVQYATSYELQISTNAIFTAIVLDSTQSGTLLQVTTALNNCAQYFWRVRAKNAAGASAYTASRNFKVVVAVSAAPALISPADGQTNVSAQTPFLTWSSGDACAKLFIVEVATDTNFATVLRRDTLAISQTSEGIGQLTSSTKYFWRVRVLNGAGVSAYHEFSFTTTAFTKPDPPVLSSPVNGATGLPTNPTLMWDTTARAKTYRLQVALDIAFTLLVKNDSTIATNSKQVGPLLNSTTYYWRVNAKNDSGTSAFSSVFSFTTLFPPGASILIAPSNNATGITAYPQFVWSLADRADYYRLQVAKDSTFAILIYDDSTIQVEQKTIPTKLLSHTRYYWRVTAKNSVGWGDTSSVNTFLTSYVGNANSSIWIAACETGPACDTLYFGISPIGTYGIDPVLGEYELPPPQGFGMFDFRFIDNRMPSLIGEGLRNNYHGFRNYTQIDTFRIHFQPGTGSYPILISWPEAYLSTVCDSMIIQDELGGASIRKKMTVDSSLSVTNTSVSSLLLIEYGALPGPVLGVQPPPRVLPKGFTLSQNYPNPFNPTTRIDFTTEKAAEISLSVYNILGEEVATLALGSYAPGFYSVEWNGKNSSGMQLSSGVYLVRMVARSADNSSTPYVNVRKIMMMK